MSAAGNEAIAKITETFLGYEDHGILTATLFVDYGGSSQGIGGYSLDEYDEELRVRVPTAECGRWVQGVLSACGVDCWEKVKGRTIFVIRADDGWNAKPIGLRPLPTEKGEPFLFVETRVEAAS